MAPQIEAVASSSTASTEQQPDPTPSGFQPPSKRILTPEQLVAFQQSPTHGEIVEFIDELNTSVKGVKLRDGEEEVKDIPVSSWFPVPIFNRSLHSIFRPCSDHSAAASCTASSLLGTFAVAPPPGTPWVVSGGSSWPKRSPSVSSQYLSVSRNWEDGRGHRDAVSPVQFLEVLQSL